MPLAEESCETAMLTFTSIDPFGDEDVHTDVPRG